MDQTNPSKSPRQRLFEIIELSDNNDRLSSVYDIFMMLVILASIIPLAFKETNTAFQIIDKVTVTIFIVDYILRLATADYKLNKGIKSFFFYPFTVLAIIDLLAILPSLIFSAASLTAR